MNASHDARSTRIVERIRSIPAGFVSTYGDIEPSAPRLVGRVLSTTTVDLPWYRVVRADGVPPIGVRQVELLRSEGVPFRGSRVDLSKARYFSGRGTSATSRSSRSRLSPQKRRAG